MKADAARGLLALVLLTFGLQACDTLHPPVVHNGLSRSFEVHVSWSDGHTSSGSVAPNRVIHLGQRDATLREVIVTQEGNVLLRLDEKDLASLIEKAARGSPGLTIAPDGPHEVSDDQLEEILRKQ